METDITELSTFAQLVAEDTTLLKRFTPLKNLHEYVFANAYILNNTVTDPDTNVEVTDEYELLIFYRLDKNYYLGLLLQDGDGLCTRREHSKKEIIETILNDL